MLFNAMHLQSSQMSLPAIFCISFIGGILLRRACVRAKKNQKKIKIVLRHAGNQEIPEFYNNNFQDKKSISFEVSENASIAEIKDEIAKRVKYADRSISLFLYPFGKKLLNTANIKILLTRQPPHPNRLRFPSDIDDPLYLYIVIPNY